MRKVIFKKKFSKQLQKMPIKYQLAFRERLRDFLSNPYQKHLGYHALHGKLKGYHSINVSGDIRAIFEEQGEMIVIFLLIGSHSELY